jgi:Ca2+-binding RTX toxin-like protein
MRATAKCSMAPFVAGLLVGSYQVIKAPDAQAAPNCFGRQANVVGTDGPDRLVGTPGDDVIVGRAGADMILGRGGHDLICAGLGPDTVRAGSGPDNPLGQGGDDVLAGGRGNDLIVGFWGDDVIKGGRGRFNFLKGDAGDDVFKGGPGFDIAAFGASGHGVNIDLGSGVATGHGTDSLRSIEGVEGSNFDDSIVGDAHPNSLFGEDGDDRIHGRGGRSGFRLFGDFIDGGPGNDAISGGKGFDTVTFQTTNRPITADLSTGTATGAGSDTLASVEGLFGNDRADTLTGDERNNVFWGQLGDDTLDGRGGNDTVAFSTFFGRQHPVVANLTTGTATGMGDDTLFGIENLRGTTQADTLIGSDDANELAGLKGNDSISAADGDDTLLGGLGNDRLDGGAGTDACIDGETELNCESSERASPSVRALKWGWFRILRYRVERIGLEPTTSCLQSRCSTN